MNLSSLYAFGEFGVLSTAWLPLVAAARGLSAHDPTYRIPGHTLRGLARAVTRASMLWRFDVEGAPVDDARPYVVVSNHASLADPLLLSFLPIDMRFVAKEELFRTPLVGWLLRLAGDIPLRRGDDASARAMHTRCLDTLRRGCSVMIFPEGTRSHDGRLGKFRGGAFRVAIEAGAAVLPVALHGTAACVDREGLHRAHASAEILAPIETAGLGERDLPTLRARARGAIADALARHRAPVAERYFLDCPFPAQA